jgi:hypothetical protein
MRRVCRIWPVLAITAGIAHADAASWQEYGATTKLRTATQLVETSCELDVTVRGAIALVEQRQRLANTGLEPLAGTTELELPPGAQLVALEVQHGAQPGAKKAQAALAVPAGSRTERVVDAAVVGADPAALTALGGGRFRLVLQPLDTEQEASIAIRWTRALDIRGGALRLTLPAREGRPCRGVLHATPGPGTSIARVRVGGEDAADRRFVLGRASLPIAIELAFKRTEPVVWTQSEPLGDGWFAQATTVIAPTVKARVARRVVFVVDGSRSMELVGRHRVKQLVHAIGSSLAPGTGIEAILYDRAARRVFGAWHPVDAQQLAAIEAAIVTHPSANGSDAAAALALARQAIGDAEGDTLIVHISDGVLGDIPDTALAEALGVLPHVAGASATPPGVLDRVDVHAIVLTRGRLAVADSEPLEVVVRRLGGSYRALDVEELDGSIGELDDWLRPAWVDVALATSRRDARPQLDGHHVLPGILRAGSGAVLLELARRPHKPELTARLAVPVRVAARPAPKAPIGELALAAGSSPADSAVDLARLRARHPVVGDEHAFVVLSAVGKVARSRREVTANGGPFTRMIDIAEPVFPADARPARPIGGGSAIDRPALELMFRTQLQPAAFACYQKALALAPKLAGTARFRLELGRGETTRATLAGGLGDATVDACLLDAAYRVTPVLPNPDYNSDDRVIANYPLTFSVREHRPFVIAGDADSSSPLDIEAIKGGLPVKVKAGDTSTPLGDLKVSPAP